MEDTSGGSMDHMEWLHPKGTANASDQLGLQKDQACLQKLHSLQIVITPPTSSPLNAHYAPHNAALVHLDEDK